MDLKRSLTYRRATSLRYISRKQPSARMAVYTRYARALDAEGKPLTVREQSWPEIVRLTREDGLFAKTEDQANAD